MKAIINTKKMQGMSYLNGLTFEVIRLNESTAILAIPSQICLGKFDRMDFYFDEIFDSVKSMRSFFNEWRDFIYNDDY
jgi:hypothetical protein